MTCFDSKSIVDEWVAEEERRIARENGRKLFGIALLALTLIFSLASVLAMIG